VVFTPKGLLRARPAASPAQAFTTGSFQEVLADPRPPAAEQVRRVLLCSGRVAFDLVAARDQRSLPVAVVRAEQLYPFPAEQIRAAIDGFPNAEEVFWVQDEPDNMGPWPFMHGRLHRLLRDGPRLRHISREESASPATGSGKVHELEQRRLMDDALADL
jgi:2-oxoglutarate dehydrogenase complex dehydrogenase (E1) component-like enzyme